VPISPTVKATACAPFDFVLSKFLIS
jgi:hypothetical protein